MMRGKVMKGGLSETFGSESDKLNKNQPICPKPRRPAPPIPEVLKPLRCTKHRSQQSKDKGSEEYEYGSCMIDDKGSEEYEYGSCISCYPKGYVGSPPKRTDNPLIHDVQFIHQIELLSPLTVRAKLTDNLTFNSCPASPI